MDVWLPTKVLCGTATALNGQDVRVLPSLEYHEHDVGNLALEVVGQDWSSEVMSIFLEDWEVGRVALSCHMTMDLLCQEMRDACCRSSKSLGSPRSLCSEYQEGRRRCSDA